MHRRFVNTGAPCVEALILVARRTGGLVLCLFVDCRYPSFPTSAGLSNQPVQCAAPAQTLRPRSSPPASVLPKAKRPPITRRARQIQHNNKQNCQHRFSLPRPWQPGYLIKPVALCTYLNSKFTLFRVSHAPSLYLHTPFHYHGSITFYHSTQLKSTSTVNS